MHRAAHVLMTAISFIFLCNCAEPVKDVDRTQGNLLRKSDLDGEWYMMQTITGVPPTTGFTFVGETGKLERIRWEIQEDLLVAYRSYSLRRGADAPSGETEFDGKENPVAAYRIIGHVDVMREYNASTGEQSNVISENTSDRLWFEREFVRVDWSQSIVTNFDFIAPGLDVTNSAYFVTEEQGNANPAFGGDALYREENALGVTNYFDVKGKLFVEPDAWSCYDAWWGWSAADCTASEIDVRTSFSRVPTESQYEPFHYDDQLLSRFGFFRTEYFTFDPQRGLTDQGRRYLINRHNIWSQSKENGQPIPIPERGLRTIPYYLSKNFPQDPLLLDAAQQTMEQWNAGLRVGLTALGITDKADVFILCGNPVGPGENEACGEEGFSPRIGDLRYSTLYWVDVDTEAGLLGYGPVGADPITGEVISGKAYVYGSAVGTWAGYAVDVIRYFNGDLDFDTLVTGGHYEAGIRSRLQGIDSVVQHAEALDRRRLSKSIGHRERPRRARSHRDHLHAYDLHTTEERIRRAHSAGGRPYGGNPEVQKAMAARRKKAEQEHSHEDASDLDAALELNPIAYKKGERLRKAARARCVDFHNMLAPNIEGLVESYAGRTDYDVMWREIRADIFAAVAEHEVGHTLGLRHNFQGSYDSLNFNERYWDLRQENLFPAETLGDVYRLTNLTENQHAGQMRQNQYSSIMDYGFSWQNDLAGLGKYDRAALVFGYTAGTYSVGGQLCEDYPSTDNGPGCFAQLPGLVEVFNKRLDALGEAGELLSRSESGFTYDDPGLPSISALERYHYTTLALSFPSITDMLDAGRDWMNYAQYLQGKSDENRTVRVPYLFCSDEWESSLVSCHAFDQGADPFEITRTKVQQYRAYYPFVNFRMDRPFFQIWEPLDTYFWGVFLPLSDIFQSWYVAPYGFDDLFDRTYELAINTGFNLLAEVMTTPAYGTWCENAEGRLVHLSDEPTLQGEQLPQYTCSGNGPSVYIPPGEGRRRFSVYDPQVGYYLPDKPQESGHYWATLAALWALTDPEAYVLGVDGDAGTYAISFYDWFTDDFTQLMNDLVVEDYAGFAPRAVLSDETTDSGARVARVAYEPVVPIFNPDNGALYNPETGTRSSASPGGRASMCEPCDESSQCLGYTGRYGGVFCTALVEDGPSYCVKDCSSAPDSCPDGTTCDGADCVPDDGQCENLVADCSPDWPYGQCDRGRCIDGNCEDIRPQSLLEARPTFSLATDIFYYGFLFTTASYSTRFNDQFNVFRPGTNSEVEVIDETASAQISFTNPVSGIAYAAVQIDCPSIDEFVSAGPVGLCGACEDNRDCAGFTGYIDDVFCQPVNDEDEQYYCVIDCSENEENCPAGYICDGVGNCVPETGTCDAPEDCSRRNPLGQCQDGSTCIEGQCVSSQCLYGQRSDTGAVRLIKRGQALANEYRTALSNWYRFDDTEEEEDRYGTLYYEAKYALETHIDLLETLLATYDIFGRVY